MAKKKIHIKTEIINCFSIVYESEDGHTFAVGRCPECGHKEESIQHRVDPGAITVSKLKVHMKKKHPKS